MFQLVGPVNRPGLMHTFFGAKVIAIMPKKYDEEFRAGAMRLVCDPRRQRTPRPLGTCRSLGGATAVHRSRRALVLLEPTTLEPGVVKRAIANTPMLGDAFVVNTPSAGSSSCTAQMARPCRPVERAPRHV